MVARLIAVDDDFGSDGQAVARDAMTQQGVRAAAFDHPDFFCAVRLGDFDVNPGVRVDPFDLDDFAFEQDGAVGVKLAAKCVVRRDGQRAGN